MLVAGLTVMGEDLDIASEIQKIDQNPKYKKQNDHEEGILKKRLAKSGSYQDFIGPETRIYEDTQIGAMALYFVNRGIKDREEQARVTNEIVSNTVTALMVNSCVELTLSTSEYLTIGSLQSRGIRVTENDEKDGILDPTIEGITSLAIDPEEYIRNCSSDGATVLQFEPRKQHIIPTNYGAAAGS